MHWHARGSLLRAPQKEAADSVAPTTCAPADAKREAEPDAERRWGRLRTAAPWLVVCCYLIGAVAVAWPLWLDPAGREQFGGQGDNDLFAWFLRYEATAVSHGHLPALITVGMNAPQGISLMWNTSFLLPGVLLAPLTLLAGPQVSLTLAVTLGFAGSAASLFWVLRRWGASTGPAALGGAVYGFSPAMLNAGFAHYHLQFAILPPLIADAVLRLIAGRLIAGRPIAGRPITGRGHIIRVGAWLGLLLAAQLLTGEELLVYTVLACLILTVALAASHPRAVSPRIRPVLTGLAVAVAVFLLLDGYVLWVQFGGPLAEHSDLLGSATSNLAWFVTPSAALFFHTHASAAATPPVVPGAPEDLIYLGWPLLGVLVIAAVVFWRDVRVRTAAVAWLVLGLFELGGADLRVGHFLWSGRLLPWHWLQGIPGLAQVIPGRFSILADGAAAAVLAFSLDRARAAVPHAKGPHAKGPHAKGPHAKGPHAKGPHAAGWRSAFAAVAVLAVLPLVPLPYKTAPLARVPAGWQATFTRLRLPSDAPVLVLPFSSGHEPEVLRWYADTGQPSAMIGGYFIGPGPHGQASFFFSNPSPETAVASYLNDLWIGQHPPSLPSKELQTAFGYWRPAAIVVVVGQRSPVVRVLARLFGRPSFNIGQVIAWAAPRLDNGFKSSQVGP